MSNSNIAKVNMPSETKRRTIAKSLLWRFIGVFWTWGGAYIIISMLPENYKNALTIATLVTVWHHSTRMVMYYIYERIWTKVDWGRIGVEESYVTITARQKILWIVGILSSVALIFWLLFYITPSIKKDQNKRIKSKTEIKN